MRRILLLLVPALAAAALLAAADAATGVEPGTVVAVVDTGVLAATPELTGRVLPGVDLVEGDAAPGDPSGHGTAVAAAVLRGCAGCRILPVRVLSESGAAPWARVADGVVWAVDHGARVVNLSVAGGGGSPELRAAIAYARRHDVVVVAAAGNIGSGRAQFPAAYPGVVAVGATGADGRLLDWSSRGAWVDLSAPGCAALPVRGSRTWTCGTSFAAPVVAAAAGRLRGEEPEASAADIAGRLPGRVPVASSGGVELAVTGRAVAGSVVRADASPFAGASVRWFRCGENAGPHDCVAVSRGAAYRVSDADRGSRLVARAVTKPFGGLWLAASEPLAVR